MTEIEILKRQIFLKRQARRLIADEIAELKIKLALKKILTFYEDQIGQSFDPALSSKIDCLNFLLEN